jgi:hypothetical protein
VSCVVAWFAWPNETVVRTVTCHTCPEGPHLRYLVSFDVFVQRISVFLERERGQQEFRRLETAETDKDKVLPITGHEGPEGE